MVEVYKRQPVVRTSAMEQTLDRMGAYGALPLSLKDEIRSLGRTLDRYLPGAEIYGDAAARARPPGRTAIIVSGWAYEVRILFDGRRQIFSFLLPGDSIILSKASDFAVHAVIALTAVEVVDASALGGARVGLGNPIAAFADAARAREERLLDHIVRLGRQSAYERVVHLLLELRERLEVVGLVKEESFRLPLTQEIMADALGLSIVHINRTLQQLRREGMIELKTRGLTLRKPRLLAEIAGYEQHGRDMGGRATA